MTELHVWIEGVGLWAPQLPDWPSACKAFRQSDIDLGPPARIPASPMLTPADRRRAPETVSLALQAGLEAVQMAKRNPSELLSVFTSAHGEQPIVDNICETLVNDPLLVSPTRFLHSIHNAPAGVWGMAAANPQASTALSAERFSFANGLLEAITQCLSERQAVLLIGYDTSASGALREVMPKKTPLAIGLVLSNAPSEKAFAQIRCKLSPRTDPAPSAQSGSTRALDKSGMAAALPLLESIALGHACPLGLALSDRQTLKMTFEPL